MTRRWLVLAHLGLLAAALPGCFGSHGPPGPSTDAGPPPTDAAACRALPASVMDLRCEMRGEVGYAVITTSPTLCCGSGTPRADVTSSATGIGTSHSVELAWTACDCCEACRCIGPVEALEVPLGVLSPGTHTVHAGGLSCTMAHFPSECSTRGVETARFPRFLLAEHPFAATAIATSLGGCGCSPGLAATPASIDLSTVSLCGCCDACDCIDGGYEVNVELGPLAPGPHEIVVPHGVATTMVVERERTHPLPPPTSLRIEPPPPSFVRTGPPIWWAVIGGDEVVCCTEPAPVVDRGLGPAGEIALSVASANEVDCACIGAPAPYEAWFPLVDLPPGEHVVRAGALTATIAVP